MNVSPVHPSRHPLTECAGEAPERITNPEAAEKQPAPESRSQSKKGRKKTTEPEDAPAPLTSRNQPTDRIHRYVNNTCHANTGTPVSPNRRISRFLSVHVQRAHLLLHPVSSISSVFRDHRCSSLVWTRGHRSCNLSPSGTDAQLRVGGLTYLRESYSRSRRL